MHGRRTMQITIIGRQYLNKFMTAARIMKYCEGQPYQPHSHRCLNNSGKLNSNSSGRLIRTMRRSTHCTDTGTVPPGLQGCPSPGYIRQHELLKYAGPTGHLSWSSSRGQSNYSHKCLNNRIESSRVHMHMHIQTKSSQFTKSSSAKFC